MIKGLAGVAVAGATPLARAADSTTNRTASDIDPNDIAGMDRILGWQFTPEERAMMETGLASKEAMLKRLRKIPIDPTTQPAIHFDPKLPGMKYPSGLSSCCMSAGATPAYNGQIESVAFLPIVDLARLIRDRKITSTELTQMYLDRLKRFGPKLNCVITLTEELALRQAKLADQEIAAGKFRSPLHGIPWGAKDLLATKGIPTTWGAKPYIDQVFDYDATVVQRLAETGAVLVAKLSMGELAMGDVWFGGQTKTPWNPSEGSSGSSAGPAAAVAGGLVGFSIGTETMGSIVSPCLVNGTTGLRPTYGRVSRFGAMALSWTMDKLGPICRGVEDCALVLASIAGPDDRDITASDILFIWNPSLDLSSLRVGYNPAAFDQMQKSTDDPAKKKIYADALEKFRSIAGELHPISLPPTDKFTGIAGLIIDAEGAASFSPLLSSGKIRQLKQQDAGSWPNIFRIASMIPAADYLRAMQLRTVLQNQMAQAMQNIDLYINIPYSGPTLTYTNLTGHPSLILRCGMFQNRPLMIELIGNLYREDAILALGHEYEKQSSWSAKWPDMTNFTATSGSSK